MAYSSYYFTFLSLNRRALKLPVKPNRPITAQVLMQRNETCETVARRIHLLLHHDQHGKKKKVLAACFSSTVGALKQNRGRKQKMH